VSYKTDSVTVPVHRITKRIEI